MHADSKAQITRTRPQGHFQLLGQAGEYTLAVRNKTGDWGNLTHSDRSLPAELKQNVPGKSSHDHSMIFSRVRQTTYSDYR